MKQFRFKKIDAFTGPHSPGNPAGCVYLESRSDITEAEMRGIARQLKGFVSEVAYVFQDGQGYTLKYYSAEREVDFCGHATLAAFYDLMSSGALGGRTETAARINAGSIRIFDELNDSGSVYIQAPEPSYPEVSVDRDSLLCVLGITGADLDERYPLSCANCGLNTLLVPLRRASLVTDLHPGFEELLAFCDKLGVVNVMPYTDDHIDPGTNFRTRVFSPSCGYLEDPATGSASAAFGNMLMKEGIWKGGELVLEQGSSFGEPNIVKLRQRDGRVQFGGRATVRIDGSYLLDL